MIIDGGDGWRRDELNTRAAENAARSLGRGFEGRMNDGLPEVVYLGGRKTSQRRKKRKTRSKRRKKQTRKSRR